VFHDINDSLKEFGLPAELAKRKNVIEDPITMRRSPSCKDMAILLAKAT
jgi:hypothetical protein